MPFANLAENGFAGLAANPTASVLGSRVGIFVI